MLPLKGFHTYFAPSNISHKLPQDLGALEIGSHYYNLSLFDFIIIIYLFVQLKNQEGVDVGDKATSLITSNSTRLY